jgi:hypothetical protein
MDMFTLPNISIRFVRIEPNTHAAKHFLL